MTKSNNKTIPAPPKEGKKVKELHDFVVEFRKYRTELTEKYINRVKWEPVDASMIKSFIPGTIASIFVKEGDAVKVGQEIMILEAMKMRNTVFSEVAGIVKKINTEVGEQVPKGKVIFEIELFAN